MTTAQRPQRPCPPHGTLISIPAACAASINRSPYLISTVLSAGKKCTFCVAMLNLFHRQKNLGETTEHRQQRVFAVCCLYSILYWASKDASMASIALLAA